MKKVAWPLSTFPSRHLTASIFAIIICVFMNFVSTDLSGVIRRAQNS